MPSSPANLATQADDAATTLWHDEALGRRISDGGSTHVYYSADWQVIQETGTTPASRCACNPSGRDSLSSRLSP